MKRKTNLDKGLLLGMIVILIGASAVPVISQNYIGFKDKETREIDFTLNYPLDGSVGIELNPELNVTINTLNGLTVDVTFLKSATNFSTKHIIYGDYDSPESIIAVDLDSDGDVDVLGGQYSDIVWLENDGNQVFTMHEIGFADPPSIVAVDLDNDGDMDILCTISIQVIWWENDGNQVFTMHVIDDILNPSSIVAVDLDGDGDVDVLGDSGYPDDVAWWENDGNQVFTKHVIDNNFDPSSIVAVDLDNDTDMDILGASEDDDEVAWWENDGNQVFTKNVIAVEFDIPSYIIAVDMDNDTDMDILCTKFSSDKVMWWENDGNQVFRKHLIDGNFLGVSDVFPVDLDSDGDVDVLGAARLAHEVAWWENDGNQVFITKNVINNSFFGAFSIVAVDLDNDSDIDVLAGARYIYEVAWWENQQSIGEDLGVTSGSYATYLWQDLEILTTYSWRIVIEDTLGARTFGPTWNFTTGNDTVNYPPTTPMITGPVKGLVNIPSEYTIVSSDPDDDNVWYLVNWGDDNITEWFGPYPSGQEAHINHSWITPGTYLIQVQAKDEHNALSNWSEPFLMTVYQLGDVNGDTVVSWRDIDAFVAALVGLENFNTLYPEGYYWAADINQDDYVNWRDIDPFIELLHN